MTSFQPWTVKDSLSCEYLFNAMQSADWFAEMLRLRLLEIYDRDLVDQIIPFKPEHIFPNQNSQNIEDKDAGYSSLYTIDDSLLYMPPKADKLEVDPSRKQKEDVSSYRLNIQNAGGSNCFAVHGDHTQKGKPFLACDPHQIKSVNSQFYLTRLTWNETKTIDSNEDKDADLEYKTYLVGATLVGVPVFSYGRSPYASWGVTALYPDVMDLFIEDVKEDGMYLDAVSGNYEAFETFSETMKVRFGSDIQLTYKATRNGVVIDEDLLDGSAGQAMPWISQEAIKSLPQGKAYSLAWILDPII